MAASLVSSNLTSGFIDLATFDELEKYMYGGKNAITYFVRETRKSTWFTQVPTVLSRGSGTADFGQEWSANISRAGDYLLQLWLRVEVPEVGLKDDEQNAGLQLSPRLLGRFHRPSWKTSWIQQYDRKLHRPHPTRPRRKHHQKLYPQPSSPLLLH
jgi:hypothetical protein